MPKTTVAERGARHQHQTPSDTTPHWRGGWVGNPKTQFDEWDKGRRSNEGKGKKKEKTVWQ